MADLPSNEGPAETKSEVSKSRARASILSTIWVCGWKFPRASAKPNHLVEELMAMRRAKCPGGNTSLIRLWTSKGLRAPSGRMTHFVRLSSKESSSAKIWKAPPPAPQMINMLHRVQVKYQRLGHGHWGSHPRTAVAHPRIQRQHKEEARGRISLEEAQPQRETVPMLPFPGYPSRHW
eukprot:1554607-Amphidinium_carterae.1